jgi:putative PIN family toxin of toxin-antitoxin system
MAPPRAVPDTNVLVAAAISPDGTCGQLLKAALERRWVMVASPKLLAELADVLARRKFRRWLTHDDVRLFVDAIRQLADMLPDPSAAPPVTRDPDDDYLVALARAVAADAVVSGDPHLTELHNLEPPVLTPAAFLATINS